MPSRLKRYQTFGSEHFITFSCYQRAPLLDTDHARSTFEQVLEITRERHNWEIYGYVLMPEHVHMLVSEPKEHSLSTTLSVLKKESSRLLKGGHPQFWQTRYHDFNVLSNHRHTQKLHYIHRNPVVRDLVENPEDWPWSSYHHYLTGERGRVLIQSEWLRTPIATHRSAMNGAPEQTKRQSNPTHRTLGVGCPIHAPLLAHGWG